MHLCHGGPIYTIQCGAQRVTFEMHRVCGPIPLRVIDFEERILPDGHRFWKDVSRWAKAGEKADEYGRCVIEVGGEQLVMGANSHRGRMHVGKRN